MKQTMDSLEVDLAGLEDQLSAAQADRAKMASKLLHEVADDSETFKLFDAVGALRHAATVCKQRAGVAAARKMLFDVLVRFSKHVPSVAAVIADVKRIKAVRSSKTATVEADVAEHFGHMEDSLKAVAMGLGVVEDLLAISASPRATGECMGALLAFSSDARAVERISRFSLMREEAQRELDDILQVERSTAAAIKSKLSWFELMIEDELDTDDGDDAPKAAAASVINLAIEKMQASLATKTGRKRQQAAPGPPRKKQA